MPSYVGFASSPVISASRPVVFLGWLAEIHDSPAIFQDWETVSLNCEMTFLCWETISQDWEATFLYREMTSLNWETTLLHWETASLNWETALLHWETTSLYWEETFLYWEMTSQHRETISQKQKTPKTTEKHRFQSKTGAKGIRSDGQGGWGTIMSNTTSLGCILQFPDPKETSRPHFHGKRRLKQLFIAVFVNIGANANLAGLTCWSAGKGGAAAPPYQRTCRCCHDSPWNQPD